MDPTLGSIHKILFLQDLLNITIPSTSYISEMVVAFSFCSYKSTRSSQPSNLCYTLSLHHPPHKYIWPRVLKLSEPPHYAIVQPPVNFSPSVPNITTLF